MTIMGEDIITFELAKKIKKKGYPQKSSGDVTMHGTFYYGDGRLYENGGICEVKDAYTADTVYEVMKWMRENKKIYIMIDRSFSVWNGWHYFIVIDDDFENPIQQSVCSGRTYEVAALDAIEYICETNLI